MDFDTIMLLALPGSFLVFLGIEALMPSGRDMPAIRHWRLIGLAGLAVSLIVSVYGPLLLVPYLPPMAIVDLNAWGNWAALPLWMLTTFFGYWAHRTMHYFDVLWRAGHQLHHGVARVDISSAFIFHPFDIFVQGVAAALLAAGLLHVTAYAAAWAGLWGFMVALYQHWNIRTPAWSGWIIQRPEAHMLHHERDVHARNFGDMPLWDRIFGTYAAPVERPIELGFLPERSRRWLAMAMMVDVNRTDEVDGRIRL
ncbi:sterol desaturase family protein [Sphingomonas sp.]|uniref:sterol desaturase family protein n=1 Tax=Sphingomonas sp. TaxID=28214 RepID=UPI00286BBC4F|nr:sterol desaturase family protein [Sphingomonas sp.]